MRSALSMLLLLGTGCLVSCGDSRSPAPTGDAGPGSSSGVNGGTDSPTAGGLAPVPVSSTTTTETPGATVTGADETTGTSATGGVSPGNSVPSSGQTDDVSGTDSDFQKGDAGPSAGVSDATDGLEDSSSETDTSGTSVGETDGTDTHDEGVSSDTATLTDATSDDPGPGQTSLDTDTTTSDDAGDCAIPEPGRSPVGYGAATTGGGNTTPTIVNNFAEAEAALAAYQDAFEDGTQSALVLRYTGNFDFSTITDVCRQHTLDSQILQIKEMENVTFEGAPGSSANFGIKINRAKNVIVRNMTMGLLQGGGDSDAITIEGNGTNGDVEHVWIDHNELFSSTKDDCEGAGDTEFDGLIDIKKGARYITISYNYIHDHQKTGLLGHSDSDDMDRYVTFHHNWYDNVVSRTPLHRFGYVHIFNNYYNHIASSGINIRMGGVALIEANFFENAVNPITSRYSDEVGFWDLRGNHVGEGISWTTESDTLANADDWLSTTTFPASELSYSYAPHEARCVKAIVMATAGAKL